MQPSLDKATMHPAFPDVSLFSIQKLCFSLFFLDAWLDQRGYHRAENPGNWAYCLCCRDSLSVTSPSGTGTLRPMPLDSTGLTMHIHRCFCHGNPRFLGTSVSSSALVMLLIRRKSHYSPPQHVGGTQLPSMWELIWPIHYGTLLQSMPKFFSEKLLIEDVKAITCP